MGSTKAALPFLIIVLVLSGGLFAMPTASAKAVTIVIEMRDFQFHPNEIHLDPNDVVTIQVFNNETTPNVPHTFDVDQLNVHIGSRSSPLLPGQQGVATFTANQNGTFWFHCDIQGHATASADGSWSGMAGRLIVGQGGSGSVDATPYYIIGGLAAAVSVALVALYAARRKR